MLPPMPLLVVAFQVEDGSGQILHLIQYRVTWFCLNLLCHSTLCCSNTTAKAGKAPPCFRKMLSLCSYMLECFMSSKASAASTDRLIQNRINLYPGSVTSTQVGTAGEQHRWLPAQGEFWGGRGTSPGKLPCVCKALESHTLQTFLIWPKRDTAKSSGIITDW